MQQSWLRLADVQSDGCFKRALEDQLSADPLQYKRDLPADVCRGASKSEDLLSQSHSAGRRFSLGNRTLSDPINPPRVAAAPQQNGNSPYQRWQSSESPAQHFNDHLPATGSQPSIRSQQPDGPSTSGKPDADHARLSDIHLAVEVGNSRRHHNLAQHPSPGTASLALRGPTSAVAAAKPAAVEFPEAPEAVDAQSPRQMGTVEPPRAASDSGGGGPESAPYQMLSDGIPKSSAEDVSNGLGTLIEVCLPNNLMSCA